MASVCSRVSICLGLHWLVRGCMDGGHQQPRSRCRERDSVLVRFDRSRACTVPCRCRRKLAVNSGRSWSELGGLARILLWLVCHAGCRPRSVLRVFGLAQLRFCSVPGGTKHGRLVSAVGVGSPFFFQIKAALLQVNCDLAFLGIRESTAFPLCVGTGCTVAGQRVGKQELERLGDSKFKVNFFTCTWQCSCTFVMFLTAFSGCCFCMFSMLLY